VPKGGHKPRAGGTPLCPSRLKKGGLAGTQEGGCRKGCRRRKGCRPKEAHTETAERGFSQGEQHLLKVTADLPLPAFPPLTSALHVLHLTAEHPSHTNKISDSLRTIMVTDADKFLVPGGCDGWGGGDTFNPPQRCSPGALGTVVLSVRLR